VPERSAGAIVSDLAQVDDQDVTAALTTMSGSAAYLEQFKARAGGCPRPLAWVSLVRTTGEPAGTVRLRSGTYFSPTFNLSDMPVRVAIPYPGPYEAGRGVLMAMNAGGSAIIALLPAWHMSAQGGEGTREVTWRISDRCKQPDG
jgi:hypothetical protein